MSTIILAIESSCDETSASVCVDGKILSNFIANQTVHEKYGGVVPELASRAHMQNIVPVVDAALKNAAPQMEIRSRRVGGANYQVPYEVRPERRLYLAMTWLLNAARAGKGKDVALFLAQEIISASKNACAIVIDVSTTAFSAADARKPRLLCEWRSSRGSSNFTSEFCPILQFQVMEFGRHSHVF